MVDGWGVPRVFLCVSVSLQSAKIVSATQRTISRLIKAMGWVMMGGVYVDRMPEFLKANGGIDNQTFCTAYE